MQSISSALNKIKDGYLAAVQWVDDNPQKTIWAATVLLAVALVF